MTRDTKIDDLNKELQTVDTSTLTTLNTTNTSVLEIFSDRISTVTNSTSDDNWDDAVKKGISTAITSIVGNINNVITSCTYIANSKTLVDNLKKLCNDYVTEYDKYENMGPVPNMYNQEKDENGKTIQVKNPDYADYMTKKAAFEDALPKLAEEVHRVETAVKNYFKAIDLTTNTIDGSIYAEGSGDIKFDYSKYFDGRMAVKFEGWVDPPTVTEEVNAEDQTIVEHKDGEYETTFEDGSSTDVHRTEENTYKDINGDGKIDDTDKLIYQKIHEDGTFTDSEGNVYGYLHDEESDEIGLIKSSTTLTDQDTGETVYEEDQERLGAYQDQVGISYVEGEVVTRENGMTTHTRTVTWGNGTESGGESYSYTINDADPACGVFVNEDGERYEYFRRDGVLYERDPSGEESVHEPINAIFTVCDETGKVIESIPIDADSQLDIAKVRSYLDNGNLACNYVNGQGTAMVGQLFLADSTSVYNVLNGKGFEYHIEYE